MNLLPAVILEAEKQKEKVARLVDYCRNLDGTELQVIKLPEEVDRVPHPRGVELAIRFAGRLFDTPWLYLEADSVPLKKGWLEIISSEYAESGKLFMLPSLEGLNPNDVASAIGVWPAQLQKYLPEECHGWPWFDYYVYLNHPDKCHFTKTIQHSYGTYHANRVVRRHHFPRDKRIIYPEAAIFHADPSQSLITQGQYLTIYHSGDLGDIIAALPVIRKQGGGNLYIGPHYNGVEGKQPRGRMTRQLFESIKPLLLQQPYIRYCDYCEEPTPADHDLSQFRLDDRLAGENLAQWQARSLGRADQDFDLGPWLKVDQVKHTRHVVFSRSLRYRNYFFPWRTLARRYRKDAIFIGTRDEHARFEYRVNQRIPRAETKSVLDLARLIAGARLQISNQSLPWWIGAGLGKTVIQETCPTELNSVIERDNLFYSRTPEEVEEWRTQDFACLTSQGSPIKR